MKSQSISERAPRAGPPTIAVSGLSKKFCPDLRRSLLYGAADVAGEIMPWLRTGDALRRGEFWALREVSFELCAGDAMAVIGHNGAGKSTLLKILYGLLQPDAGKARLDGSIVALIELGIGFNPLLTARENIRISAALHGLSRRAAGAIVSEVLDFAELHAVADVAVQSFSTGMRSRLAYAIAAMLRPRILLVDEALAVGDLVFQRKCISHMQRFLADGGTLLLVSHALYHIQAVCRSAILLDHGEVVARGDVADVIHQYLALRPPEPENAARDGGEPLLIDAIRLTQPNGGAALSGAPAMLTIEYRAREAMEVYCGFALFGEDGWVCITSSFDREGRALVPGKGALTCRIPTLPLVAGRYRVRPLVADRVAHSGVALGGRHGAGATIVVQGEADLFSNAQMQMGQLVVLQADWQASDPVLGAAPGARVAKKA